MTDDDKKTEIVKYEFNALAPVGDASRMKAMMQSDRMHEALTKILPQFSKEADPEKHIERMIAQAGIAYTNNTRLQACTQLSFFESMMHVAETGLSLSKQSGEAYLVPFNNSHTGPDGRSRKLMECTFMPGYRGLIKLAHQTGGVKSVDAVAVNECDEFKYWEDEQGPHITHEPDLDGDRSDVFINKVYARIQLVAGGRLLVVMTRKQVEKIRQGSKSKDSPAWKHHWGEMAKKTAMKRALKTVPQSTHDQAVGILERAIELDNRAGGFVDAEIVSEHLAELQAAKDAEWKSRLEEEPAEPKAPELPEPEAPDSPERDPNDPSTWEKAEDGQPIPPNVGQPKESDNV